jgi:hypothetical protein
MVPKMPQMQGYNGVVNGENLFCRRVGVGEIMDCLKFIHFPRFQNHREWQRLEKTNELFDFGSQEWSYILSSMQFLAEDFLVIFRM